MKKAQILFIIFVLTLLIIPWFHLPQVRISGFEEEIPFPTFSYKSLKKGIYQKQINSWWNRNFGWRSNFIILKNDIYEMLNIGNFHSSSSNNILEGQSGVLYDKVHYVKKFTNLPIENINRKVSDTVSVIKEISDKLKYIGKEFLFIMAPQKVDIREDALPKILKWREKYIQAPPNLHPIWENAFKEKNIIYIDGTHILQHPDIYQDAFPDTGIHWTLLGAGAVWEQVTKQLHDAGTGIPAIHIKKEKSIGKISAGDRDIADILNILPKYNKGKKISKMAEYDVFSENNNTFFIIGDSFSSGLYINILQSGFNAWIYSNNIPQQEVFFDLLKKSDVLILIYYFQQTYYDRIKNDATQILNLFNNVYLDEWHGQEYEGQWSKNKSYISFFCASDDDYELLFTLKEHYKSKYAVFTINDIIIHTIDLERISLPNEVKIFIPRNALNKGMNKVEVNVKNAMSPLVATQGETLDLRQLGVFCSDIRVQRSPK